VIGKVCRRGSDVRRLLGYLFLEGQAGDRGLASDHSDAHVVAGYQTADALQPLRRPDGRFDVSRLAGLLNAPVVAGNVGKDAQPVYHLAISAAKADRLLSDEEWADIAGEYVHRIGLAPRGDDEAVRWVAVRHAVDHVHVVATLVRQDGRRVFPRQDFLRSRDASRAVEDRYGLTTTAPAGGTSTPETTRAEWRTHREETERRRWQGRPASVGPDREVLRARVHDALARAGSWEEFSDRLSTDGVLLRPRYSTTDPGEVTGYAVALRPVGRDADHRQPVWFGGGKLAPDLTFPRLRQRWIADAGDGASGRDDRRRSGASAGAAPSSRLLDLTVSEREALWRAAQQPVESAEHAVRSANAGPGAWSGPSAQADAMAAAMGASDVLHAVSRLVELKRGGPLREAAEHYDRASRPPRGQVPPATATSRALRTAARGLLTAGVAKRQDTRQLLALMNQLASLAEAVARLRETERQAARAAAARRAEEQLLGLVIRISTTPEAAARAKVAVAGLGVAPARVVPPWPAPTRTPTSSIGRPAARR
jgi:hypothetical protein